MELKNGVIMPTKLVMRVVLLYADDIWRLYGEELVVTSGMDGTHSPGSIHYYGYAVDLRTRYFKPKVSVEAAEMLSQRLGPDYSVVWHETHIHVGYNKILKEGE